VDKRCYQIVFSCISLIGTGSALGAEPARVEHPCAGIAEDAARLACYDEAFGRRSIAHTGESAAAPVTLDAGVAASSAVATVDPVADFGLTDSQKRARDPEQAKKTMPDSITATVAHVRRRPTGELVVTLDNGQVWAQTETVSQAVVKPGDLVTIRKGALGSFVLVTANRIATKVQRTK
jgi:hypothetical protein